MKIIRASIDCTTIYVSDDELGLEVPAVDARLYGMYLDALTIICKFEQEVDKVYETQSSSSASSTR